MEVEDDFQSPRLSPYSDCPIHCYRAQAGRPFLCFPQSNYCELLSQTLDAVSGMDEVLREQTAKTVVVALNSRAVNHQIVPDEGVCPGGFQERYGRNRRAYRVSVAHHDIPPFSWKHHHSLR